VLVDARVIKLGRDVATIEVQLKHGGSGHLAATVSGVCRAPCHLPIKQGFFGYRGDGSLPAGHTSSTRGTLAPQWLTGRTRHTSLFQKVTSARTQNAWEGINQGVAQNETVLKPYFKGK